MKIRIISFVGSVGSGKTTGVMGYQVQGVPCVYFLPGQICRGALGRQAFNCPGGNTPEATDAFVLKQFFMHVALLKKIAGTKGEGVIVSDGWPRNGLQAGALIQWLHRRPCGDDVRVHVHHLLCDQQTWERRLRNGRWVTNPELEALDRTRYSESIADSLGSIAVLRSAGIPYVTVETHPQEERHVAVS